MFSTISGLRSTGLIIEREREAGNGMGNGKERQAWMYPKFFGTCVIPSCHASLGVVFSSFSLSSTTGVLPTI